MAQRIAASPIQAGVDSAPLALSIAYIDSATNQVKVFIQDNGIWGGPSQIVAAGENPWVSIVGVPNCFIALEQLSPLPGGSLSISAFTFAGSWNPFQQLPAPPTQNPNLFAIIFDFSATLATFNGIGSLVIVAAAGFFPTMATTEGPADLGFYAYCAPLATPTAGRWTRIALAACDERRAPVPSEVPKPRRSRFTTAYPR
jgi:hypothetical protein